MPNDKLASLAKLCVESERRGVHRSHLEKSRRNETKWMRNAKNDDDYYYRACRGHSFQQHFVSLNEPHTQTTKMKTNKYLTLQQAFTLLSTPNSFQSIKFICHLDCVYASRPKKYLRSSHTSVSIRIGISHVTARKYPLYIYICFFGKLF